MTRQYNLKSCCIIRENFRTRTKKIIWTGVWIETVYIRQKIIIYNRSCTTDHIYSQRFSDFKRIVKVNSCFLLITASLTHVYAGRRKDSSTDSTVLSLHARSRPIPKQLPGKSCVPGDAVPPRKRRRFCSSWWKHCTHFSEFLFR